MDITAAIWRTFAETPDQFVEATNRFSGLSFETVLPGGFGSCSLNVGVGGWNAVRWYRDYVGHHLVLFDHLGRRLYEGRVETTDADGSGVQVSASGYYAHARDLTHGMVYPASTPTSISDIIEDTVLLSEQWSHDLSMIKKTVTDVTPKDYSGDKKLGDVIEDVLKTGDDGVQPVPLHFAIWEHRRAHLFREPQVGDTPTWQVFTRDFGESRGLSLSRSRQDLFNRIQVLFDDPDIGQTFTDWFEDPVSQALFGVREGSVNIGSAVLEVANLIAQLALNAHSRPTQSSRLGISGRVYTAAGAPDFPYMVRAGSLIRINDYDPTVSQLVDGQGGRDAAVSFISRTRYNADNNTLEVELGSKNVALDILMARIGMSSSSVR